MKTQIIRLLAVLAAGYIGVQPCVAQDDYAKVNAAFEAALDAQIDHDFATLADFTHPFTLKFFRERLNETFEQLAAQYADSDLLRTVGIESSPMQSDLSDKDLFVKICNRAAELEPTFSGDENCLPVTVHGIVFSKGVQAFVVYEFPDKAQLTKSKVRFNQPGVIKFMKVGDRWLMQTAVFSGVLPALWARELNRLKTSNSKGQQGGADQPATAPESKSESIEKPNSESEPAPR